MEPQLFLGERPREDLLLPIKNPTMYTVINKPEGGLWTSPYRDGYSPWLDFAIQTIPHELCKEWWVLQSDPDCRILLIDSIEKAQRIPLIQLEDRGAGRGIHVFDYEALSRDWDALYFVPSKVPNWQLIDEGIRQGFICNYFWGFDCECCLWFRWRFTEVKRVSALLSRDRIC